MASNGGFAIVASLGASLLKQAVRVYHANLVSPIHVPLSPAVVVAGHLVNIGADLVLRPPDLCFRQRSDDLVETRLTLDGTILLNADGGGPPFEVEVILSTTFHVRLAAWVEDPYIVVGLDLSEATVDFIELTVVRGAPLGSVYGTAVHSSTMLEALSEALRAIPPGLLRVAPPALRSAVEFHSNFGGAPLDVVIPVSGIVVRPMNDALVVAADVAGYTQGDRDALVDIRMVPGYYGQVVYAHNDGSERWRPDPGRNTHKHVSFAVTVNGPVLSAIIANQVSPAVSGRYLNGDVRLDGLSLEFGWYKPPHAWGRRGATMRANVHYRPAGISAEATIYLEAVLWTREGDTSWVCGGTDHWAFNLVDIDVSLPAWLSFVTALVFVIPSLVWPILAPLFLALAMVAQETLGAVVEKAEEKASGQQAAGLSQASVEVFGPAWKTLALPGTTFPTWVAGTRDVVLSEEGIDVYADLHTNQFRDEGPSVGLHYRWFGETGGEPAIKGAPDQLSWPIEETRPIEFSVGFSPAPDPRIHVAWQLSVRDTGEVIYASDAHANDPAVLVCTLDHEAPQWRSYTEFTLLCRVYQPMGSVAPSACQNTQGAAIELLNRTVAVSIKDYLDRTHPYVWWQHTTHFDTFAHPEPAVWTYHKNTRQRTSRIHRTAYPGRCKMIHEAAHLRAYQYLDELPFPKEGLLQHRDLVCDYCFFGGPDKCTPLV